MNFDRLYRDFATTIARPSRDIDLALAALQIARFEYPRLQFEGYLEKLDGMADDIKQQLPDNFYPLKIIQIINQYLYVKLGFRGNQEDYYDPRNSYLNDVIDRRTGIPITLSIVYLEIAKRIDFPMVGVGLPGHFIIRPDFEDVEVFVDPFNGGEIMFEQDCEDRLSYIYQQPVKLEARFLTTIDNRQILTRTLTNLKYIYLNRQRLDKTMIIIELLLLLNPDNALEIRDRGLIYYELQRWNEARENLTRYLSLAPDALDAESVRQILLKIG